MEKEVLAYFNESLTMHLREVVPPMRSRLSVLASLEASQEPMDEIDQTCKRYEQEFTLRMQHRNERQIQEILDALQRIRNGKFGICSECGRSIEMKRLKAHPTATLCIDCKKELESAVRRKVA